jgi:asparagine synthase (glutamine-hydrolysing)
LAQVNRPDPKASPQREELDCPWQRHRDLYITGDVRLDNRKELISIFGQESTSYPDTSLILRAYARWGYDCPRYLLGDFAFAIWDGRQEMLFCARDHIGVKPFYYYTSPRLFALASELKALFRLKDVPRQLNEVRVADYLVPLFHDLQSTFFRNVLRLPPGHMVMVGRDQIRLERYWSLETSSELHLNSDQEYTDAFLRIFTEAVRGRLDNSGTVGALLSGGLDSSSITCVARNLLAERGVRPFPTFSAIFPDVPQCDERPFIQAVHEQGGLDSHLVRADQISPLDSIDAVMHRQDEPFFAPNLFIHHALYRKASQQGVRVLFDGIDGDTTVSHGLAHMVEQARVGEWRSLLGNIRGLTKHSEQSVYQVVRKYLISPLAPTRIRRGWSWIRSSGGNRVSAMNPTIRLDFSRRVALDDRCAVLEPGWATLTGTERQHHYRRLTSGIVPFALEILDRAATMYGIEPRFPFCDKRLIEFCYAVPAEQKLHKGWTRMMVRRAMGGILPCRVQWRGTKSNLSANFNRGLLQFERAAMDRVILTDSGVIDRYVDISKLRRAYARFQAFQSHTDAMTIWKSVTLALWLEQAFTSSQAPMNWRREYGTLTAS